MATDIRWLLWITNSVTMHAAIIEPILTDDALCLLGTPSMRFDLDGS